MILVPIQLDPDASGKGFVIQATAAIKAARPA
jgi:hypothetical protein